MLVELGYGLRPRRQPMASGPTYLNSVVASTVCDLDATIAASYGGSGQTWANLIAAPADGVAQTGYDFHLGADSSATATDPTFTGTAGTPSAYFNMDGGDYFRLKTLAGTLFSKWHRTSGGTAWWAAIAFRTPSGIFTTTNAVFGNCGTTINRGNIVAVSNTEQLNFMQASGSATSTYTAISAVNAMTGSQDNLLIVSGDSSGTNNVRRWLNSDTKAVYSVTYQASSSDSTDNFYVGATKNGATEGALPLENNTRVYAFAAGNAFIDDAQAAAIRSHLATRHGRSY